MKYNDGNMMDNYRHTVSRIVELFMLKADLNWRSYWRQENYENTDFEITNKAKQANERKWIKWILRI